MTTAADGAATIEWIEPTTGTIRATLSLASEQVRQHLQLPADSVATRLYPQWLCTDGDQVFLPIDGALSGDTPRLLSLDREGRIGWHWQGSRGSELQLAATLPGRVVLVEGSEGSSGRCVVLASSDGAVQQEVRIGYDVRVLNWERSWLANPAPDHLAIESFADAGRTERQLVVVPLRGAGDPFVVPLANEEGDLMRTPLFGADFLTFVTRPRRNASVARLYAIDLGDRSGRWPEGRRYQRLDAPGACDGVANFGRYTVVSGAQGLLLLGATKDPR
jgi:hypothetical protein